MVNETDYLISVTDNEIKSNIAGWGGGVQVHDAGIIIDSNIIQGNDAAYWDYGAGGIAISDPENYQVTVVNNVIVDNQNEGLEISNFSEADITNNTLVNNGRVGIEVFAWPNVPPDPFFSRIHNNIVVGHTACGVSGFNGVTIIARSNDIWNNSSSFCGSFVGWNNISEDPLFVNAGSNDFHLRFGSPVVDKGTNVGAPDNDIENNPRPQGRGFDIGAYELTLHELFLPIVSITSHGPPPGYVGQIAFVSERDGNQEIYLVNEDGTGLVNLSKHWADDFDPAWTPDGSKIAFGSDRAGTDDIYVITPNGTGLRRLTALPTNSRGPEWSPDGSKIAFASVDRGVFGLEIYWVNADGSGLTRVYNGPLYGGSVSWSPDGQRLLFDANVGHFEIFTVNLDGSGLQPLVSTEDWEFTPAWSPDGKYLAFASDRLAGSSDIFVADADGNNPQSFTGPINYSFGPVWSPNSQWLTFMSYLEGLYVMRPDGSEIKKLTSVYHLGSHAEWSWSPHVNKIAFAASSGGNPDMGDIYVVETIDGGLKRLTWSDADDMDPNWHP